MTRARRQRGFSLIELVITIVVMGIIAGISSILLSSGVNAYLTGERVLANAPAARLAMERTLVELREACDGSIAISSGAANIAGSRIDFNVPNDTCDTPAARVIQLAADRTLQLRVNGNWYPLALNVSPVRNDIAIFSAPATSPVSGCKKITVQFTVSNSNNDTLPVRSGIKLKNQACIPPAT
ncbi:PilW family protein [Endothiovibrio diazotrophicus]